MSLVTRFDLTEPQANAILEMQLRRLAALEQQKLQDEFSEVMSRIAYLEDLLASPAKILALIHADVHDLVETYGDERRTDVIYGVSTEFNEADLVREEEVVILLSKYGYIKRVPSSAYRQQRRGGKGVMGMLTKEEDGLEHIVTARSLDTLLFFTDKGKVYSEKAYNIPEGQRASKGTLVQSVMALTPDEHITSILAVPSFETEGAFIMATQQGRIKRVDISDFADVRPSGLIAMNLDSDDRLNWAKCTSGDQNVILVTENGQSIRFHEREVRVMGRQAAGVNSIRLLDGDIVVGMDAVRDDITHVLVVTRNGYGKRTPVEEYGVQGRYGQGVRTLARNEKTGPVVAMRCIDDKDDILLMTRNNVVLRTRLDQIREVSRNTQGVKLIDLADDDEIIGVAIMDGSSEIMSDAVGIDDGVIAANGNGAHDGAVAG